MGKTKEYTVDGITVAVDVEAMQSWEAFELFDEMSTPEGRFAGARLMRLLLGDELPRLKEALRDGESGLTSAEAMSGWLQSLLEEMAEEAGTKN